MPLLEIAYDWSQWYDGWSVSGLVVVACAGAVPIMGLVVIRVGAKWAIWLADTVGSAISK